MSASGETLYSYRTPYPDVLQVGRANVVQLEVYRNGALVAPTSGTFTLLDPAGTTIDSGAVTVGANNIATRTIAANLLPTTVSLGDGWQEVWALLISGVTYTVDREAAVARRPVYPCISDVDLVARYSSLAAYRAASLTSFQTAIDDAWKSIVYRWIAEGGALYRVKSQYAFREPHIELALSRFFQNSAMGSRERANFLDLADKHMTAYDAAWKRISVLHDFDDDGRVDDSQRRDRAGTVITPNVGRLYRMPTGRGF